MSVDVNILLVGLVIHGISTLGGVFIFMYNFGVKVENRITILETELKLRRHRKDLYG